MAGSLGFSFPTNRLRDLALVGMLLFLLGQNGLPAIRAFAQDGGSGPRANTPLTDSFIYQGRVIENGVPANGTYDFEFKLFDAATGGGPIVTLPVVTNVPVTNGLFTVQLNFGSSFFQGSQRWLGVDARKTGTANFTSLGRQELTATPYALYAKSIPLAGDGSAPTAAHSDHDHLGQNWVNTAFARGFQVTNNVTDFGSTAIHGTSTGEFTVGVGGEASGGGIGLYGVSVRSASDFDPERNIGVVGRACEPNSVCLFRESDARRSGVYGESVVASGVFGIGLRHGVEGISTSPSIIDAGVQGQGAAGVRGFSTAGDEGVGVYGNAFLGSTGTGVLGVGSGTGVEGTGDTGVSGKGSGATGVGVYGEGSLWAGNFNGNVQVTGTERANHVLPVIGGGTHVVGDTTTPWTEMYAGAYKTPSDVRLKKGITSLDYGLEEVLKLQPVSFQYARNDTAGLTHLGLLAQDVERVLPEVVHAGDDPEQTLSITYSELIPVLIRAIQEQQAEIDALCTRR